MDSFGQRVTWKMASGNWEEMRAAGIAFIHATAFDHGDTMYVGACGCEQSKRAHAIVVEVGKDVAQCVFCRKTLKLSPLYNLRRVRYARQEEATVGSEAAAIGPN